MKNYFVIVFSFCIALTDTTHAQDGKLKGFLFGGGISCGFSADQVTTEFLEYTEKTDWNTGFGLSPQCKFGFAPNNQLSFFIEHRSHIFFRGHNSKPLWYPFLGLGTTVLLLKIPYPLSAYAVAGACQMYGQINSNDGNIGFGSFAGLSYEFTSHVFINLDFSLLRPRIIYNQLEHYGPPDADEYLVLKGYFNACSQHNLLSLGLSVNYLLF